MLNQGKSIGNSKESFIDLCREFMTLEPRTLTISEITHRRSLVPRPRAPPGEKRSGERSRISWAYYPKRVMTNEIARSAIIT